MSRTRAKGGVRRALLAGATATAVAAVGVITVNAQAAAAGCRVTYTIGAQWNGGFTADVTVRNTGTTTTPRWRVSWTWPGGQTITNAWNATATRSGSTQVASSLSSNGAVAPGATTSFGFQASGSAVTPVVSCSTS